MRLVGRFPAVEGSLRRFTPLTALGGPREQARRAVLERARDRGQLPAGADVDIILQVLTGALWHHLAAYPDTTSRQALRRYLTAVLRQTGYRPEGAST